MRSNAYTKVFYCNIARSLAEMVSECFSKSRFLHSTFPLKWLLTNKRTRMVMGDPRAQGTFTKDVEDTYSHLVTRVLAAQQSSEDAPGGVEQIQLVPENPSQTISFNVPDGPPPENITLEGPGTEGLDLEEVKKALQLRWDVFDGFSEDLKEALKEGTLDGVNKVLGNMSVDEAEEVVKLLDMGGILSFAEGGIRDETGGKGGESD